ncbi:MAG: hypothetical protein J5I93_06030 [Pirellulaceae bacterium]|nr:hypothetical protein [Pirellulaceae bacterium]
MRVLPVIDLKHGQVVHAIAGRRENYEPVSSRLTESPSPSSVAAAFARLGLTQAYVADLDAIAGEQPDRESLRRIGQQGLRIWLDAGLATPRQAHELREQLGEAGLLAAAIVGLESVADPALLRSLCAATGPELAVFSLDLRDGRPLAGTGWGSKSPLEIAQFAWDSGFRRMIVLDLAGVGTGQGVAHGRLLCELKRQLPELSLVSGGGVRSLEDLRQLHLLGCDAALVASALHAGALGAEDLLAVESWPVRSA